MVILFKNIIIKIKHIKYIFHALQRPNDFWKWIINETKNDFEKSKLVNKAFGSYSQRQIDAEDD